MTYNLRNQGGSVLSSPIVLIDGYNLMNQMIREGLSSEKLMDFRYQMLRQLDRWRQQTGKYRVWVVFDGRRKREDKKFRQAGSVRVFFALPPDGGDSRIESMCHDNDGKVVLVTSDKELIARTCNHVVKQLDSSVFLEKHLSAGKDLEDTS